MKDTILDILQAHRALSELDVHFARLMARLAQDDDPRLALAAALTSNRTSRGHICLHLASLAGVPAVDALDLEDSETEGIRDRGFTFPDLASWTESLVRTSVVGAPGQFRPLVLDQSSRLYLYRYWQYEDNLVRRLRELSAGEAEGVDLEVLREGLARLFPGDAGDETDWQKVAAAIAVTRRLCVITGGPGTGKTSTVARVLTLLIEQAERRRPVRSGGGIALAAPTGKAAARLQESIQQAAEALETKQSVRSQLPENASTLHRLLGSTPGSSTVRFNAAEPLAADVVVVDEASMVPLALMAKLVDALPPHGRLILLGDRDQLASVEAGAVLGDISSAVERGQLSESYRRLLEDITAERIPAGTPAGGKAGREPIADCIAVLEKSYRFGRESGIRALSQAVNSGDGRAAVELLKGGGYEDVSWRAVPPPATLSSTLEQRVVESYSAYLKARTAGEAFDHFRRFRILCALRAGPYGVTTVNRLVEEALRKRGLIPPRSAWYPGRPVLVTANDYSLRVFNGDIGIVLSDPESDGKARVFFPADAGSYRKIPPLRLREFETAYAMTVHKSQGSEFDDVLLLLPDAFSRILSRELLYTGLTRARKSVEIWGSEDVLPQAIAQRIERTSGLREALWG